MLRFSTAKQPAARWYQGRHGSCVRFYEGMALAARKSHGRAEGEVAEQEGGNLKTKDRRPKTKGGVGLRVGRGCARAIWKVIMDGGMRNAWWIASHGRGDFGRQAGDDFLLFGACLARAQPRPTSTSKRIEDAQGCMGFSLVQRSMSWMLFSRISLRALRPPSGRSSER